MCSIQLGRKFRENKKFSSCLFSFLLFWFYLFLLSGPAYGQEEAKPKPQPLQGDDYNSSQQYHRPEPEVGKGLTYTFEFDFFSQYVWNGLESSQGAVWQPSGTVEYNGLGFNVWSNFVLDNEPNQGQFNEVDLTLYYAKKVQRLGLEAAVQGSLYPNGSPRSLDFSKNELTLILFLSHPLGPVDLATDIQVEFLDHPGAVYWTLGIAYHHDLPLNFGVKTSTLFGVGNSVYNHAFIDENAGAKADHYQFSLSFPWTPLKGLCFTPNMNVSTLLAGSLRGAVSHPTLIWGGLTITYSS